MKEIFEIIDEAEREKLSSRLLYSLYYEVQSLDKIEYNNNYYFQILAEVISEEKIEKMLKEVDLQSKLSLIDYCLQHYREGSYTILKVLEKSELASLVTGLKRGYYDLKQFDRLIKTQNTDLMNALEEESQAKAEQIFCEFNHLIQLMIQSPLAICQTFKKNNPQALALAEKEKSKIEDKFRSYFQAEYTSDDFKKFIRIFGTENYLPYFYFFGKEYQVGSLLEKILLIKQIFSDPLSMPKISQEELVSYFTFVHILIFHLETLCRNPERYRQGIDLLACGIPTKGKLLSTLPTITSLIRSLKLFEEITGQKINKFPIFIYDQSDSELFLANHSYLEELKQKHSCSIFHISTAEILALSDILEIRSLIETAPINHLGYGGARNAVFLLTPLLHKLFQNGQSLGLTDRAKLKLLFEETTLKPSPSTLLMLNDNMQIAETSLLSYSQHALENQDSYYFSSGYSFGRNSQALNHFFSLKAFLETPQVAIGNRRIYPLPNASLMSEYIGKPKLCLNLPFGKEEAHFMIRFIPQLFVKPSYHLPGMPYPNTDKPTRSFIGFENFLRKFLPYTIEIQMCLDLLGEPDSPLFWNEDGSLLKCSSLEEILSFLKLPETQNKMRSRFEKRLKMVFSKESNHEYTMIIKSLCEEKIEQIKDDFARKQCLSNLEKEALDKVALAYQELQNDAKLLLEFGRELTHTLLEKAKKNIEERHSIHLENFQLCQALYLLCQLFLND